METYINEYKLDYELWKSGKKDGELEKRLEFKYSKIFEREYKKCKYDLGCTEFHVGIYEHQEKNMQIYKKLFKNFGQLYNLRVECHKVEFNYLDWPIDINTHEIYFKYN